MGFHKINLVFYLFYWLRFLLIVCGNIESSPGPGSDRSFRVLYSYIRDLHFNLDELVAEARLDYDVLVTAETKVSDCRHLLQLHIPGFGCPQ